MSSPRRPQAISIEKILEDLDEPKFPKVDEFLGKVFDAPQYDDLSVLEREQAVLDFLSGNRGKWQEMLAREGLFAGQTPENINAISTRCTIEKTNRLLIPSLIEEIRKIDFRYVEIVKNTEGLSETLPLDLIDIEMRALKRLSGRAALKGPFDIIRSDVVERYTLAADERNGVVADKALGPLKKHLNVREINHCIKSALLLRNSIYLSAEDEKASIEGFTPDAIDSAIQSIVEKYPQVPPFLLKMALYANLTPEVLSESSAEIPAAARLVWLFAELGEALVPTRRKQTGLQVLESSLLHVMFDKLQDEPPESIDVQLLEEFVSIADENEW
jgi:hypothetical protein